MLIIQTTDFTGAYTLAKTIYNTGRLQEYIDRYEEEAIKRLMGKVQGEDFIADKSNPTQDPIYAVIEDAFFEQESGSSGTIHRSRGLKDLLLAYVFYHYVIDSQNIHTQSGVAHTQAETSNVNTGENAARKGERAWNEMISTWEAIQWYCKTFAPTDYPDFAGEEIAPRWSAVL